jgi:hypothetical protein
MRGGGQPPPFSQEYNVPLGNALEPVVLDQLFGNLVGQVNQVISAPAATTTTITVMGSAGSGNMDITAAANQIFVLATPSAAIGGGSTSPNEYTNVDVITASTGSTGTSIHIASQTIGKSRAVGDAIFLFGSTTADVPIYTPTTLYLGLSTRGFSGATDANILSGEPSSSGDYARIPVINNNTAFPDATGIAPAASSLNTSFSFPASSGAWSSGSTLNIGFISDTPVLGAGNVIWYGQLNPTVVVNAASITVTFGVGSITLQLL